MKQIATLKLSRGLVATIDSRDYGRLGREKWHASGRGRYVYAARNKPGGGISLLHREVVGAGDHQVVDHINGDRLDNRRENLRICTHGQNIRSQRPQSGGTSKYKGVSFNASRRKWAALIRVDGKRRWLGWHTSEEDAARAYDCAARMLHGDFALTNQMHFGAIA